MTTIGSTCFHVNKEAGPERGGACPRSCAGSTGPASPIQGPCATGTLCHCRFGFRALDAQGQEGGASGDVERWREPGGGETKKKSQSRRELEMAN